MAPSPSITSIGAVRVEGTAIAVTGAGHRPGRGPRHAQLQLGRLQGRRDDGLRRRDDRLVELHPGRQRQLSHRPDRQRQGRRRRQGRVDDRRRQRRALRRHHQHRSAPRVEGTAIAVTGGATDPAGAHDTLSYSWAAYKDGATTAFAVGTTASWSFTPDDNGSYRIALTVSDEDGGSATAESTIDVANVASFAEHHQIGACASRAPPSPSPGAATDPAGAHDTLSYSWAAYKDGATTAFAVGTTASWSFTPDDNGSYRIALTVSDEDGGSATAESTIDVANVAPSPSITSIGMVRGRRHRRHRRGHRPGRGPRHAQLQLGRLQGDRATTAFAVGTTASVELHPRTTTAAIASP